MLELTTRFAGISTSPKSGHGLSQQEASSKAKANLRYITRRSALDPEGISILTRGEFFNADGTRARSLAEIKASMRRGIDERAQKGGANGIRVAEKLILSLPNDFDSEASAHALRLILRRLAKGSRTVKAIAAIHADKPGNRHAHILLLDGLETEEQARKRRPDAKRIRRGEVVRMGDMGRPKEVRALIAKAINDTAEEFGLSCVEHRSFKDRGITFPATRHEGTRPRNRDPRKAFNAAAKRLRAGAGSAAAQAPVKLGAEVGAERARPQASNTHGTGLAPPACNPSISTGLSEKSSRKIDRKRRSQAQL